MLDFVTCLTDQSSPTPQLLRKMYGPSFNSSSPVSLGTPTPTLISQPSRSGGHYAPKIASVVYGENEEIDTTGNIEAFKEINLKSVLDNGITEPSTFHRPVQHVSASIEQASTYYLQEYQYRRHFGLMVKVDGPL